jgi:ribosomal protein S18 acetylase RimI-like enzyme
MDCISALRNDDVKSTSSLITQAISVLTYYNDIAIRDETEKYSEENIFDFIGDDKRMCFIHKDESGEIDGAILAAEDDGICWLYWFIVKSDKRKGGVGTKLLAHLAAECRTRGLHKIWCDSRTDNAISAKVLEKANFTVFARANRHWYGQDFFLWEHFVEQI